MITMRCKACGKTEYMVEAGEVHCLNCGFTFPAGDVANDVHEAIMEDIHRLIKEELACATDHHAKALVHANLALEALNLAEFSDFCNQLVNIKAEDSISWLLKGAAVAWNTTMWSPQNFDDTVSCMLKAVELAQDDQIEQVSRLSQEILDLLHFTLVLQMLENLTKEPSMQGMTDFLENDKNMTGKLLSVALATEFKKTTTTGVVNQDDDDQLISDDILEYILMDSKTQAADSVWDSALAEYQTRDGGYDIARIWMTATDKIDDAKEECYENTKFARWSGTCIAACYLAESAVNVGDLGNEPFSKLVLSANAGNAARNLYVTMNNILKTYPSGTKWNFEKKISEMEAAVADINGELQWRLDQGLSERAKQ